jgi:hypothetical protein
MILFGILMHLAERVGDACGNLLTTGSTNGLASRRPLWVEIAEILALGLLVVAGIRFGFLF